MKAMIKRTANVTIKVSPTASLYKSIKRYVRKGLEISNDMYTITYA